MSDPEIVVTEHARQRARDRYDDVVANSLSQIAGKAKRLEIKKDGLQFYRGEHGAETVFMLCAEKSGTTLGLFEVVVVTLLTPEQAEIHGLS